LAKLLNISYIPVAIFTIILTGSRTSLVAILPFGIYVALSPQIKFNRKVLVFVGLVVSALILLPFVPPEILARLGTIGASIASHDLDGRVRLWGEAIALLAKHPILGIGGGTLYTTIGAAAHNTFVSVAAETGFVGFALFLSTLGLAVYLAMGLPGGKSGVWLAILSTWAIGVLSLSWEFRKETWLFLTFVMIESSFAVRSQADQVAIPLPRGMPETIEAKEPEFHTKVA
jgi:O-antigen ligase